MTLVMKLELLQCRYPYAHFKDLQHGLPTRPDSKQTSTAERHSSDNESREDQRRREMPERLPVS